MPVIFKEKTKNFASKLSKLESEIIHLKNDNLNLQNANVTLTKDTDELKSTNEVLTSELAIKDQQIAMLKQAIFGKKSEKAKAVCEKQLSFLFDEAEVSSDKKEDNGDLESEDEYEDISFRRKKGGRKKLPKNLPRERVIHELPECELQCDCGSSLCHIGEDVSEELHFVPAKLLVKEHVRYKYACKSCEENIKRAPAPFRPLGKALASSSLISDVLVKKYEDHLPLYRQSKIWGRLGIHISRQTISNWVISCGDKFDPIVELMKEDILSSDYVCSDETSLNVLQSSKETNYMWLHMSGVRERRALLYEYDESRSQKAIKEFVDKFTGYHQCDAYSSYNKLHNKKGVIGIGCMSHARRKFMDILKIVKNKACGVSYKIVGLMKKLYSLEQEIKEHDPDEKKRKREEKAKPILDKIYELLIKYKNKAPPGGMLAKAINYSLNQWDKLSGYLKDGRIRIDNNDAERAIKPFVIGRKNWLFSNSENGAKASCIIYSLIETCKANNIKAFDYLKYLLENIRDDMTTKQLRCFLPYNIDPAVL